MKIAVFTLGCKLNQCESEALADAFYRQGSQIVPYSTNADLYIVNTCTVTSKAEQKARRMIRKFASQGHAPDVLITGCYAQMEPEILRTMAGNIHIVPLTRKHTILNLPEIIHTKKALGMRLHEIITEWIDGSNTETTDLIGQNTFDYKADTFIYHSRAFLKIEDGCDHDCAYCRVTIARGAAVSLDREEVVRRAVDLEEAGYSEIVLTGVNITAYRHDGEGLEGLLRELLKQLKKARIRLSSLEPDMITESLVELCRDERVQPHFHIPVQSGSDSILAAVNRHYTAQDIVKQVNLLKSSKDDPFLAADVITGLPGERDEDAQATYDLLANAGFSQLHVFPYSPRPGTKLHKAANPVPEYIRDKRAAELRILSQELFSGFKKRWAGRQVEVILENAKDGYWIGLSGNYLRVKIRNLKTDDEQTEKSCKGKICLAVIDNLPEAEPNSVQEIPEILTAEFIQFL